VPDGVYLTDTAGGVSAHAQADTEGAKRSSSGSQNASAEGSIAVLARESNRGRPIPIRADRCFVIVSESGTALTKAGLDNAWQDLMHAAIEAKVITPEDRFSLHGLKHRAVTDTKEPNRQGGSGGPYRTRTYNQLIKSCSALVGASMAYPVLFSGADGLTPAPRIGAPASFSEGFMGGSDWKAMARCTEAGRLASRGRANR
jgi:hypothetical protein